MVLNFVVFEIIFRIFILFYFIICEQPYCLISLIVDLSFSFGKKRVARVLQLPEDHVQSKEMEASIPSHG